MSQQNPTPKRRGPKVIGGRKEFPVHGLLDEKTKAVFDRVIEQRQESQSCFVRRAVRELLAREVQAA